MDDLKVILLSVTALIISGCAGTATLNSNDAEEISKIQIIKQYDAKIFDYDTIKTIEGMSCRTDFNTTPPTIEEAISQIKIEAAGLGANAVIIKSCNKTGFNLLKFCDYSITCTGSAITLKGNKIKQCEAKVASSPKLEKIKHKVSLTEKSSYSASLRRDSTNYGGKRSAKTMGRNERTVLST